MGQPLSIALFIFLAPLVGFADDLPKHIPQLCTGLHVERLGSENLPTQQLCRANAVIIDALIRAAQPKTARGGHIALDVICCPLPASDILTSEVSFVEDRCPTHSLATGIRLNTDSGNFELRCTALNARRYQLGAPSRGRAWGVNRKMHFESTHLPARAFTPAVRYALGRYGQFSYQANGCIGQNVGMPLVGKMYRFCWGLSFAALQYRGLPLDPPAGTPITMFPDCLYIERPFSRSPHCVARTTRSTPKMLHAISQRGEK